MLDISLYEAEMWVWYHSYIQRPKIERIETPCGYSAWGSMADKVKGRLKFDDMKAMPPQPKITGKDLINSFKKLFAKRR